MPQLQKVVYLKVQIRIEPQCQSQLIFFWNWNLELVVEFFAITSHTLSQGLKVWVIGEYGLSESMSRWPPKLMKKCLKCLKYIYTVELGKYIHGSNLCLKMNYRCM